MGGAAGLRDRRPARPRLPRRVFQKLLLNFTWWVNQKDAEGNDVFEGGFLGLDNIGPIDRSSDLPEGLHLEQSDGTAWMAMYASTCCAIALVLAEQDPSYEDIASKFFEHFARITVALNASSDQGGLWDHQDGFYYDVMHVEHGESVPLRVRSMVGLSPLYAAARDRQRGARRASPASPPGGAGTCATARRGSDLRHLDAPNDEGRAAHVGRRHRAAADGSWQCMLDEDEFLSPTGCGRCRRATATRPFVGRRPRASTPSVGYEPAESLSPMFGGNSNWRGPIWFPVNFLLLEALRSFARYAGDSFTVEHPTGSGQQRTLARGAPTTSPAGSCRSSSTTPNGRRPVFGGTSGSRPTRRGTTSSRSTSTSTATTAPASAPPTRPAGPASSPTSSPSAAGVRTNRV